MADIEVWRAADQITRSTFRCLMHQNKNKVNNATKKWQFSLLQYISISFTPNFLLQIQLCCLLRLSDFTKYNMKRIKKNWNKNKNRKHQKHTIFGLKRYIATPQLDKLYSFSIAFLFSFLSENQQKTRRIKPLCPTRISHQNIKKAELVIKTWRKPKRHQKKGRNAKSEGSSEQQQANIVHVSCSHTNCAVPKRTHVLKNVSSRTVIDKKHGTRALGRALSSALDILHTLVIEQFPSWESATHLDWYERSDSGVEWDIVWCGLINWMKKNARFGPSEAHGLQWPWCFWNDLLVWDTVADVYPDVSETISWCEIL